MISGYKAFDAIQQYQKIEVLFFFYRAKTWIGYSIWTKPKEDVEKDKTHL